MRQSPPPEFFDRVKELVSAHIYAKFPDFDPNKDYAGPENNKKLSKRIPESLCGCPISAAAWVHDCLYLIGGDEETRLWADQVFHELMLWLIDHHDPDGYFYSIAWHSYLRDKAKKLAKVYYLAVLVGGKGSFTNLSPKND